MYFVYDYTAENSRRQVQNHRSPYMILDILRQGLSVPLRRISFTFIFYCILFRCVTNDDDGDDSKRQKNVNAVVRTRIASLRLCCCSASAVHYWLNCLRGKRSTTILCSRINGFFCVSRWYIAMFGKWSTICFINFYAQFLASSNRIRNYSYVDLFLKNKPTLAASDIVLNSRDQC